MKTLFGLCIVFLPMLIAAIAIYFHSQKHTKLRERISKVLRFVNGEMKNNRMHLLGSDNILAEGTYKGRAVKMGIHEGEDSPAFVALRLNGRLSPFKLILKSMKPTPNTVIQNDWLYFDDESPNESLFDEGAFPKILEELVKGAETAEHDPAKFKLEMKRDEILKNLIKG